MAQRLPYPKLLRQQQASSTRAVLSQPWPSLGRLLLMGSLAGGLFLSHHRLSEQELQRTAALNAASSANHITWLSQTPQRIASSPRDQRLLLFGLCLTGGSWWILEYVLKLRQRLETVQEDAAVIQTNLKQQLAESRTSVHVFAEKTDQERKRRRDLEASLSHAQNQIQQREQRFIHIQEQTTEQAIVLQQRHRKIWSLRQQRCYLLDQNHAALQEIELLQLQLLELQEKLDAAIAKTHPDEAYVADLIQQCKEQEKVIRRLQQRNSVLIEDKRQWEQAGQDSATNAPEPRFSSMLEVLDQAEENWGDVLEIWDSAKRAAAPINHQKLGKFKKVYRCLEAIAAVGCQDLYHRHHDSAMGHSWEEAMAAYPDVGSKYRPHESSATMVRYGDQRRFSHQGESKVMTQHMTINGPDGALQIYFDVTDQSVQIGYCGPHLDYDHHNT